MDFHVGVQQASAKTKASVGRFLRAMKLVPTEIAVPGISRFFV